MEKAEPLLHGMVAARELPARYPHIPHEVWHAIACHTSAAEDSTWCIMQIVREPWKYWAFAGVMMMLAGAFLMFIQGPSRRKSDVND